MYILSLPVRVTVYIYFIRNQNCHVWPREEKGDCACMSSSTLCKFVLIYIEYSNLKLCYCVFFSDSLASYIQVIIVVGYSSVGYQALYIFVKF